jgi:hypothetical protein
VRLKGERIFLDELPPDADAPDDAIDCGPVCQIPAVQLSLATESRPDAAKESE